jgi:hypothetical protein
MSRDDCSNRIIAAKPGKNNENSKGVKLLNQIVAALFEPGILQWGITWNPTRSPPICL